jgi:hypothetical protein
MSTEERDDGSAEGAVEVARIGDLFEARILAGYLESFGIRAHIPDKAVMGVMDGAAVIWSEGVRVEVPARQAEEAKRVLAEREERRADPPPEQ